MEITTKFTKTADLSVPDTNDVAEEWARHAVDSLNRAKKLKQPWRYKKTGTGKYEVSSDSPGLPFLITGTRPHAIQGHPLLHFLVTGQTNVFTRRVQHPGTKPDARLVEALAGISDEGITILDKMFGV